MDSNVLTLKDLAIQLDLPESTLRKYRDAFAQYIPTVGSGRDRRYTQDAADVFAAIRDCRTKEHLSWEDTSRELAKRFPVDAASIDKHGLPVPDRVPVSAQAAAILRRLESANEDTAFILNTIGAEIINISKMMQRQGTAFDDIGIIRRSIYNQDKDLRDILLALRQLLENTPAQPEQIKEPDDQPAVMGQLARLQSSMAYLVRQAEKRPATEPGAPQAPATQDIALLKKEIIRLRALLKEKEDEIAQNQVTNRRLKMENEALKTRLADMSRLDDNKEQELPESITDQNKPASGKFFFRGKKK